jgi:agmatinase
MRFLDLPDERSDPDTAAYVVLPVPYEATVTYRAGTADAPAAILDASAQVELFDEELGAEFVRAGVATHAAVGPAAGLAEQMTLVREAAAEVAAAGRFPLALGGEHSITPPLVEACAACQGPLSVLQIDAHADLRDSYGGSKHSHACVMRRVLEITGDICQVGVRSYSREERDECPREIARLVTPRRIADDPDWLEGVMARLAPRVYVTVDMDGFDPSVAPGVGTPEPGGLTWHQVTGLLRRVCAERRVVGADIVEARPLGANHVTEFVAARLAYKMIAYTQQ